MKQPRIYSQYTVSTPLFMNGNYYVILSDGKNRLPILYRRYLLECQLNRYLKANEDAACIDGSTKNILDLVKPGNLVVVTNRRRKFKTINDIHAYFRDNKHYGTCTYCGNHFQLSKNQLPKARRGLPVFCSVEHQMHYVRTQKHLVTPTQPSQQTQTKIKITRFRLPKLRGIEPPYATIFSDLSSLTDTYFKPEILDESYRYIDGELTAKKAKAAAGLTGVTFTKTYFSIGKIFFYKGPADLSLLIALEHPSKNS